MNEEQIRIWNDVNAARWLGHRAAVTRAILPHGHAAMEALAPAAGARVLDVGCGRGETTLDLAHRVGAAGAVVGVDVSEPFLAIARAEAAGHANVAHVNAHAQTHAFAEPFDACFSRFGVMFFADPTAAFANLRGNCRPGGRLAVVVWGPPEDNEWVTTPLAVVRPHLDAPMPGPGPGPYSLGDHAALTGVLDAAGWREVKLERLALPYFAGESAAQAAKLLLIFGPAGVALRQAGPVGESLRPRLEAELAERLADRVGPAGVNLGSSAILATASA